MKTRLLIILITFCFIQICFSQEDDGVVSLDLPIRNSLVFNRFAINPTFSFVREQNKYFSITNKREWVQFNDAPETYFGTYSGRFAENIGAGLAVFQQNYGVLTTFGGLLNFAYNAKLNTNSNLTFGLNVGAYKSGVNTANVITNFDDPSFQNVPSNLLLTVNPGINYGTEFLDFGISINNIVLYNFESSTLIQDDPRQGIQAHVMHTGYLSGRGFFEDTKVSALLKSEFRKDETIISGLAMINVPKGLWVQLGYNNVFGVSGGLGINVTPNIAIEYNIEKAIGDMIDFGSSHNITLAYRFKSNQNYNYSGDDDVSGLFSKKGPKRAVVKASKVELEEIRKRAAERKTQTELDIKAKEKAAVEADAKEKLETEEKAIKDAKEKTEQLEKQKAIEAAEANAKIEEDKKAKLREETRAKIRANQKAKREAEAQAKLIAEQKAKEEAVAQAKQIAEQKAKDEAEAQAKLIAEQKAKDEAEAQAKRIAEQKAKDEAEAQAKQIAEQKAKDEAEAQAKRITEQKAKDEAEAQAKQIAEQKAKDEAEAQAKQIAEQKAKDEAEAQAKQIAEQKAKDEAEAQAKQIAEQKAKDEAEAQAKQIAEQKAKEEAEAQAKRIAQQKAKEEAEAQAKLIAQQKAKDEAEKQTKLIVDQNTEEESTVNPNDKLGKSMLSIEKETDNSKIKQAELLKQFDDIVETKNKDLKDLKEENDLSDQGIIVQPRPFKSVTAENNALRSIKSNLDEVIEARTEKIEELKALYEKRTRIKNTELDEVNLYYKKKIKRLSEEQLKAIDTRSKLVVKLESIRAATEFEKRRRIKRAVFDNEEDRYSQGRSRLRNIIKTTPLRKTPLKVEDFDFGEEQGNNIKIIKNVQYVESGYYLVLAVHNNVEKRNDFLTKVVASGRKDIDFFYDVGTSKYYIYYEKFSDIQAATNALKAKGNRSYNQKMSIVKIENK
ncbi:PorP/SprF family type IX secretion system membrane protein [Winogradskyella sp. R77965]|uniref:PorP/SprF family type IX secretion system membrane protein n=1 Tax=Winogradskyella sp. R77965 TaxID=3093872 RepID=UPI0037DD1F86